MKAFFHIMCFCNRLCRVYSWLVDMVASSLTALELVHGVAPNVKTKPLVKDELMEFFDHTAEPSSKTKLDHKFNTKAFCIVFGWGWILVFFAGMIIVVFSALPFVTTDLISKVFDTFQILIILVSLLITYKILSLGEPAIARFLHQVRDAYINLK